MAKYLKQYRYFGEGNDKNYPLGIGINDFITGRAFFDGNILHSISHLGIQSFPGTKFYLNDLNGNDYILIGSSGRYELDLTDNYEITNLRFDDSLDGILKNSGAYIIVDAVYNGMEE